MFQQNLMKNNLTFNNLMLFWLILGQRKTSSVVFSVTISYKAIRNNIVTKKTTELVLRFHKKTTKLVFLWPNISKTSIRVLIKRTFLFYTDISFIII